MQAPLHYSETTIGSTNNKNDDIRFPGSIYKIDKSDKNIILLNSGKIIFNGFDDLDEIKSIFKIIKNI